MEFLRENPRVHIDPLGEFAFVIEWQDAGTEAAYAALQRVRQLAAQGSIPGLKDIVPAYQTLSFFFDQEYMLHHAAEARISLERLLAEAADPTSSLEKTVTPRIHRIPVCYDPEFAPDLNEASALLGITATELVETHCSKIYTVYFYGFVPGFPYMGMLPSKIAVPRKSEPRQQVPAGAVGLAGRQTGIYPYPVAGGWQLIGQTPISIFQPEKENPFLFQPGDQVQFHAIDATEFHRLKTADGLID